MTLCVALLRQRPVFSVFCQWDLQREPPQQLAPQNLAPRVFPPRFPGTPAFLGLLLLLLLAPPTLLLPLPCLPLWRVLRVSPLQAGLPLSLLVLLRPHLQLTVISSTSTIQILRIFPPGPTPPPFQPRFQGRTRALAQVRCSDLRTSHSSPLP